MLFTGLRASVQSTDGKSRPRGGFFHGAGCEPGDEAVCIACLADGAGSGCTKGARWPQAASNSRAAQHSVLVGNRDRMECLEMGEITLGGLSLTNCFSQPL